MDPVAAARELAARPGIAILGVAGQPGAGKSTLAERIVAEVSDAVLVGMDGFHLAHDTLIQLGRVERKGAPDTFDAYGYVALLRRIRGLDSLDYPGRNRLGRLDHPGPGEVVWAPEFDRDLEDAIAGAVAVTADVPLVVTEGNYLLLDEPPWGEVLGMLDACWYVDIDEDVRRARLQARHESHGRTPEEARERTWGSDERNAVLVSASRSRASAIITSS